MVIFYSGDFLQNSDFQAKKVLTKMEIRIKDNVRELKSGICNNVIVIIIIKACGKVLLEQLIFRPTNAFRGHSQWLKFFCRHRDNILKWPLTSKSVYVFCYGVIKLSTSLKKRAGR